MVIASCPTALPPRLDEREMTARVSGMVSMLGDRSVSS